MLEFAAGSEISLEVPHAKTAIRELAEEVEDLLAGAALLGAAEASARCRRSQGATLRPPPTGQREESRAATLAMPPTGGARRTR